MVNCAIRTALLKKWNNNGFIKIFSSIPTKLKQRLLKAWISYFDSEKVFWFPRTVQIETTTFCNLSCPTCPQSSQTQQEHHLSVSEFREIIARLPLSIKSVVLSGVGEPLINPNFFEIVDFLRTRNINCCFYTNGTLLTPQTTYKILSRSNITALSISCDSANKKKFEVLRRGADFEQWELYVRNFISRARERFSRPLEITMFTVLGPMNVKEAEKIILFASDMGFDRIHFFDPVPISPGNIEQRLSCATVNGIDQDRLSKVAKKLGVSVRFSLQRPEFPSNAKIRCYLPWIYTFVRTNGDILPCYALFRSDKSPVIGNLFQSRFVDIWRGENARTFRKASVMGNNDFCRACPYY